MKFSITFLIVSCYCLSCFAACPSMDFTGDCRVNLADLAMFASQWLSEGVREIDDIVWVYIDDPGVSGHESFNGYMSKHETTNAQYCQFLNAALASGDITVGADNIVYGANGSNVGTDYEGEIYFDPNEVSSYSQITYSSGTFSVLNRDGYDMSNHPVVMVSWYGAMAFADYYGWRLPTEWEWQAVADYDGSYTYGCGTTIDQNKANYSNANPLSLSSSPWTSMVGYYPAYGYGMRDMAGNVWELTSTIDTYSTSCGGGWNSIEGACSVSPRSWTLYSSRGRDKGFRLAKDLN